MLSLLHIENIAVIEQADITLGSGFHVLTGETGAGKSIVIDAISAILGERASRDMIRTGCDSALVTALFRGVPELDWFAQTQTPYDPDELQIARRIHADGRNSCRVNGRPVTVALLRQLGLQLIQIHGQHDSQQLFDEQTHLTLLDSFARNEADRASYAAAYEAMQAVRSELASLQMDEGEKLRRTETLQHQIDEITAARLQPGEEEQLLERRRLLQNAEKLTDCVQEASAALSGGDESLGAASLLTEAARALGRAGGVSPQLSALAARLDELMYNVQDAARPARRVRVFARGAGAAGIAAGRHSPAQAEIWRQCSRCAGLLQPRPGGAGRHGLCRRADGTPGLAAGAAGGQSPRCGAGPA